MSFYYVISAEEHSLWQGNAPTSPDINQGFTLQVSGPNAANVRWVGPRVRITRVYSTGSALANVTRAANVLEISNMPQSVADALAQVVGRAVGGQLQSTLAVTPPNWTAPVVQSFSEALNGPLSWWACSGTDQSQCAAVTLTENQFPELGGRTQPDENPIGPTSNLTHPATVGQALQNIGTSLTPLLWLGGGILALYLAWPLIVTATAARAARPARANPRRRRRS